MDFFKELQRLREKQPMPCILTVRSENCDYCPYHASGKNSYLIVGHNLCEDCMYGLWIGLSRDCVDCSCSEKCELCYQCLDCRECYDCNFCQDCSTCTECSYCYDCKGCENCFGCVNLRFKKFHIFNKPYSKEEYFEKVRKLKKENTSQEGAHEFQELKEKSPHIAMHGTNNEQVAGNHIFNSKNVFYGFEVADQEDTMYMFNAYSTKDSLDTDYTGVQSELLYMCHSVVQSHDLSYCNVCWFSQNLDYCEYVFNSQNCFGCVSRNHAEYEILNKKYPKDEYFKKVREIRGRLKEEGSYGKWWWPSPYEDLMPNHLYLA